jgi:hypothetical protein
MSDHFRASSSLTRKPVRMSRSTAVLPGSLRCSSSERSCSMFNFDGNLLPLGALAHLRDRVLIVPRPTYRVIEDCVHEVPYFLFERRSVTELFLK